MKFINWVFDADYRRMVAATLDKMLWNVLSRAIPLSWGQNEKPALPESAWAIPAEGLSMPMALGNKPSGQELKEG